MPRHFILSFIAMLVPFLGMAQRSNHFEWSLSPQLDSFEQSYADSNLFEIYNKGKAGLYLLGYGKMVPTAYDEVGSPIFHSDVYESQYWLVPVKKKGKWGLYSWVIDHSANLDTSEMLPCVFDKIVVRSSDMDELFFVDVWQGRKTGTYDPRTRSWTLPLAEQHPKPKARPQQQRYVVPMIEEIEPPSIEIEYDDIGSKTMVDSRDYDAQPMESTDIYAPRDTTRFWPHLSYGDRAQFMGVIQYGYKTRYGLVRKATKEVIIPPKYARVGYADGFIYCTRLSSGTHYEQIFDTLGQPITPMINWRNGVNKYTHRLAFNEQKQFAIYDMNWNLVQPFAYSEGWFSRREKYIVLKKDQKWFLFDVNHARMTSDSFDAIHTDVECDYFLAERDKKLFVYNSLSGEKKPLRKTEFVRTKDSLAIVTKGNRQALFRLNSGKLEEFTYDSIHFPTDFFVSEKLRLRIKECTRRAFLAIFQKGKVGLMDYNNLVLVPCKYDEAYYINAFIVMLKAGKAADYYSVCRRKIVMDSIEWIDDIEYRIPPNYSGNGEYPHRINNYLMQYMRNGKLGVARALDSQILPAIFDTLLYAGNHTILRNAKGYYVLNIHKLPFSDGDYYDSFHMLRNFDLILFRYNSKTVLNCHGDMEVANFKAEIQLLRDNLRGGDALYVCAEDGKYGVLATSRFFTGMVFEDVRFGINNLVWAKQNGKWGVIEY